MLWIVIIVVTVLKEVNCGVIPDKNASMPPPTKNNDEDMMQQLMKMMSNKQIPLSPDDMMGTLLELNKALGSKGEKGLINAYLPAFMRKEEPPTFWESLKSKFYDYLFSASFNAAMKYYEVQNKGIRRTFMDTFFTPKNSNLPQAQHDTVAEKNLNSKQNQLEETSLNSRSLDSLVDSSAKKQESNLEKVKTEETEYSGVYTTRNWNSYRPSLSERLFGPRYGRSNYGWGGNHCSHKMYNPIFRGLMHIVEFFIGIWEAIAFMLRFGSSHPHHGCGHHSFSRHGCGRRW